ncbi:MAG: ribonucleotide-diphosphate reductase subunit beta [Sciscionella sp.]
MTSDTLREGGVMAEIKSPTAVLHEGPRALSEREVTDIEDRNLRGIRDVDIDDVIEYVHKGLRRLPDFVTLYRKYLKQRWDVYELDFSQDRIDWTEKMTEEERTSFIGISSGFHHGERQVEIELPVFMIGAAEEEKLHIAAQIEDEARHTVFFDRFYREVVGIEGDDMMTVLDKTFPWVQETFVGPFGLLAYQAEELRRNPYDERARVRYATTYFLWIEGVLALSVMKVTLSYARWRGFLPAYYTGFTATCRDESRHVQGGMRYLQDAVRRDPTMLREIHDTLGTILTLSGVASRRVYYEPLGWTEEEVRFLLFQQLRRKLNDVGISLSEDLEKLLEKVQPVLTGG